MITVNFAAAAMDYSAVAGRIYSIVIDKNYYSAITERQ
jgi:hypothetical protein